MKKIIGLAMTAAGLTLIFSEQISDCYHNLMCEEKRLLKKCKKSAEDML